MTGWSYFVAGYLAGTAGTVCLVALDLWYEHRRHGPRRGGWIRLDASSFGRAPTDGTSPAADSSSSRPHGLASVASVRLVPLPEPSRSGARGFSISVEEVGHGIGQTPPASAASDKFTEALRAYGDGLAELEQTLRKEAPGAGLLRRNRGDAA